MLAARQRESAPASPAIRSLLAATLAAAALFAAVGLRGLCHAATALAGVILSCAVTLRLLADPSIAGTAGSGFWSLVLAGWLPPAWSSPALPRCGRRTARRCAAANDLAIPAAVRRLPVLSLGGRGARLRGALGPDAVAERDRGALSPPSLPTLGEDFVQTFVRGVLTGYAIGCGAGFLVAIIADRFTFLGRGLLPIGNFVSALPIVGIAPIMVMWFGFDWPSKTAVVAVITFFPMLVNTLAGLAAAGHIERDLMRSYGASPAQTLIKLHLPAAMPFIFNALKINSTLALIGAIVAEFFGTPTLGIGFRISIEVARMSLDMVWAEIALAAIAGMAFYGIVALAERATTFWHPSYRT